MPAGCVARRAAALTARCSVTGSSTRRIIEHVLLTRPAARSNLDSTMTTVGDADYIIVGAGSAGGVLAGRLSENPDNRVLLLEAGGTDRTRFCTVPGMISMIHTVPQIKKKFDWGYYTAPQQH